MRRSGLCKAKCSFCNYGFESSIQIFKDCWWFEALWQALDLKVSHLKIHFSSFADWLYYLSHSLTHEEFRTAIVAFLHTWYNRNF